MVAVSGPNPPPLYVDVFGLFYKTGAQQPTPDPVYIKSSMCVLAPTGSETPSFYSATSLPASTFVAASEVTE
jgi:hypothetical protein